MMPRLVFLVIAVFWMVMNVLLWRAEYGSAGEEISVPPELVWRKILTAPDSSALAIYQNGQRAGFCEFSTSVERAMAQLDGDRPPPEGLVSKSGYKLHLDGNISAGELTNRLRFDGYLQFSPTRTWHGLYLRLTMRGGEAEIRSVASEQTVRLKISSEGATFERVIRFADLQNPNAWLGQFSGNAGGGLLDAFGLSGLQVSRSTGDLHWEAHRDRVMIAHEPINAYRLETRVLDRPVVIYTSSLGEILRVELPGGVTAGLDGWNRP